MPKSTDEPENDRTMKLRRYTLYLLAAGVLAACAEPDPEGAPAPGSGTARITLLREETKDISAYAFRRQDGLFLFDTLLREGWTPDGRLSARMRSGCYKFLFVSGAGENLSLRPEPFTRQTAWEEAVFALRENAAAPGTYLPADELFLQFPASDADKVYTVAGTDQTIRARLSRAVCRIGITVKRGFHDGTGYVEVPYAKPQSVLDRIGRIELTVSGTGSGISPSGSRGTAVVTASFSAAQYTELTDGGFARFDGPYVIPPADGTDVGLELSVAPAAGAALQPAHLQLTGRAERNKRLDITLWITSDYPMIGVEIRTAPIDREQEGDAGIWE